MEAMASPATPIGSVSTMQREDIGQDGHTPGHQGRPPVLPGEIGPAEDILKPIAHHPQRDPHQGLRGDGDRKFVKLPAPYRKDTMGRASTISPAAMGRTKNRLP